MNIHTSQMKNAMETITRPTLSTPYVFCPDVNGGRFTMGLELRRNRSSFSSISRIAPAVIIPSSIGPGHTSTFAISSVSRLAFSSSSSVICLASLHLQLLRFYSAIPSLRFAEYRGDQSPHDDACYRNYSQQLCQKRVTDL